LRRLVLPEQPKNRDERMLRAPETGTLTALTARGNG